MIFDILLGILVVSVLILNLYAIIKDAYPEIRITHVHRTEIIEVPAEKPLSVPLTVNETPKDDKNAPKEINFNDVIGRVNALFTGGDHIDRQ